MPEGILLDPFLSHAYLLIMACAITLRTTIEHRLGKDHKHPWVELAFSLLEAGIYLMAFLAAVLLPTAAH